MNSRDWEDSSFSWTKVREFDNLDPLKSPSEHDFGQDGAGDPAPRRSFHETWEFLGVVRARLRKIQRRKSNSSYCDWPRLSKFPQEVLYLTLSGCAPAFIHRVFFVELPKLRGKLLIGDAERSVDWVLDLARRGELVLEDDLLDALRTYNPRRWSEYSLHIGLKVDGAPLEPAISRRNLPVSSGVSPEEILFPVPVPSEDQVQVITVDSAAGIPVDESSRAFGVLGYSMSLMDFIKEWEVLRAFNPIVGVATPAEIVRGVLVGIPAILAERDAKADCGQDLPVLKASIGQGVNPVPTADPLQLAVVPSRRALRNPPTLGNPWFRREPGKAGRPPVYHDFLEVARRRLRQYRKNRKRVPIRPDRLHKFEQEVFFLKLAGYSPTFVCRIFQEELPNLFSRLSKEGVQTSMKKAEERARLEMLRLDPELQYVLCQYAAGPWSEDSDQWLKDQY